MEQVASSELDSTAAFCEEEEEEEEDEARKGLGGPILNRQVAADSMTIVVETSLAKASLSTQLVGEFHG